MAGTAIYSARVRKGYANRAQRVTLAAAVFDQHGRILVTPDGLLPSEVVTSTFLQKVTTHDSTQHLKFMSLTKFRHKTKPFPSHIHYSTGSFKRLETGLAYPPF